MKKKHKKSFKTFDEYRNYYENVSEAEKIKGDKYYRLGVNSAKMTLEKE